MNRLAKSTLILSILLASASLAYADLIVYDLGSAAARTLKGLGTNFVIGCVVLALGMVVAALICKRK